MKKLIVPLLAGIVAAALIMGSCAPAPAPAPEPAPAPAPAPAPEPTPEPAPEPAPSPAPLRTAADVPELDGLCRPDLWMDFGEPFAFKPDGTPFSIDTAYVMLGIEEMVDFEGIIRDLCGRAGAEYSMFDSQFDTDIQRGHIEDLMRELEKQYTVVIVTHNMQQAARVSDMSAFLMMEDDRAGILVEYGPTSEIFTKPKDKRTEDYITGRFG